MPALNGIVARATANKKMFAILASATLAILLYLLRFIFNYFLGGGNERRRIKKSSSTSASVKRTSSSGGSSSSHKHSRSSSGGSSSSSHKHKSSSSSSKHKQIDSSLPTLLVLIGVYGSGKSWWATQYIEKVHKSTIVISSDIIRSSLTGTITDFSKEDDVEKEILRLVESTLLLKRSCIIDDCVHNLSNGFREKLLSMLKAKDIKCNKVVHLFPIKAIFAMARIEKDVADGKARLVPSQVEMEDLMKLFQDSEKRVKEEGWIEDK